MDQKINGIKQKIIDCDIIENILDKFEFIINLQKFENMCYEINCTLSKYGHFLQVFELKNKYCRLTVKNKNEKKIDNYLPVLLKNIVVLLKFLLNIKKSKESALSQ